MPRPAADLRRIVDAVRVGPDRGCTVNGEPVALLPNATDDALGAGLAVALYERLYSRSGPAPARPPDIRAMRTFVEALSEANCGSGTWDPGWTVDALEPDGTLVVRKPGYELRFWVSPERFRADGGTPAAGGTGRVRTGKELREMLPGFYMALGDADQPDAADAAGAAGAGAPLVRFYWHLTAAAAPRWVAELTRAFNAHGVAFHAKVLSNPDAYRRADAGVLYVPRQCMDAAMDLVRDVHRALAPSLRGPTPMLTRRLARGLALADDPGDGRSFGQHRCQLIAEALVEAHARGVAARGGLPSVVARFARERLRADRPWLGPDSVDAPPWATPRAAARATPRARAGAPRSP